MPWPLLQCYRPATVISSVAASSHSNDFFHDFPSLPSGDGALALMSVSVGYKGATGADIASFLEQSWVHKILVGGVYTGRRYSCDSLGLTPHILSCTIVNVVTVVDCKLVPIFSFHLMSEKAE